MPAGTAHRLQSFGRKVSLSTSFMRYDFFYKDPTSSPTDIDLVKKGNNMADVVVPNGVHASEPQTPKSIHASLALTEYTANPSPGSNTPKDKIRVAGVPQEYLLPNGYPDVSIYGRMDICVILCFFPRYSSLILVRRFPNGVLTIDIISKMWRVPVNAHFLNPC